jgi:hypothetical protein
VRLVRLLISLIAVIVAIVVGMRLPTDWFGEVYTNGTTPVESASILLIKSSRVAGSTVTSSTGKFSIAAGPRDTSDRIIVCKRGFEPATIETRPRRRRRGSSTSESTQGSVVQLGPQNLDFEAPYIASLRSVLPSECR